MIDTMTASVLFIALSNLASAPAVLWIGIGMSALHRKLETVSVRSRPATSAEQDDALPARRTAAS